MDELTEAERTELARLGFGAALAQVQALAPGAARYQWLRAGEKSRQGLTIIGKGGTRMISRDALRALLSFDFWCSTEELDAAIDDAIAASKGTA